MTRLKKAYGPFVSYGELLHVGFRNWTSDPWLQTAATKNESMIQKELSEAVELTARGF
jgi:hypothetical protein